MDRTHMRMVSCIVDEDLDGCTVEDVLRAKLLVSRKALIRAKAVPGALLLNDEPCWTIHKAKAGQTISIAIDDATVSPSITSIAPEAGSLDIVFQDEDLIVVNKQAGVVMYPGPRHGQGTLANFLVHHMRESGIDCNLHPVQRLDAGTSGLVVFATSSYVQDRLQAQLHTRDFKREYLAICKGWLNEDHGTVNAPIACDRMPGGCDASNDSVAHDGMQASTTPSRNVYSVAPHGKPAVTHYQVERRFATIPCDKAESCERAVTCSKVNGCRLSLMRLRLETGRTHQIRLHMAYIGHPLLGDATYGNASKLIGRPALHSASLALLHPITGQRLSLSAPPPADMMAILSQAAPSNDIRGL